MADPAQDIRGIHKGLTKLIDQTVRAENLEALREQEQRLATPQFKRTKKLFENSMICLLGNLLSLTAINMARGLQPKQHQLKHKWSRPLHLFFLTATTINLCAVGFFGYEYVNNAPEGVKQLFSIANDPRIYLGVDKIERQKEGLKVVHLQHNQKIHEAK